MHLRLLSGLILIFSLESSGQILVSSEFTVADLEIGKTKKAQLIEKYGSKYTLVSDSITRHASQHTKQPGKGETFKIKIGETISYPEKGLEFFVGTRFEELNKITLTKNSNAVTTTGIKVGVSSVKDVIAIYGNLQNPPRRITEPHWTIDDDELTIFYDGIRFVTHGDHLKDKQETELMDLIVDAFLIVKKNAQR